MARTKRQAANSEEYIETAFVDDEEPVQIAHATRSNSSVRKTRPAITVEAQENKMISLAVELAERQLIEGTASSQVITHYLKLGTMKERLEREKLEEENKLLRAKTEALESYKDIKALYGEALKAMRKYSGSGDEDAEEEY